MSTYFDPMRGWIDPIDDYKSETYGSIKDIIKVLKKVESSGVNCPDDLYDAVENLLYKYQVFILQGVREGFGKHKGVSWYLTDKPNSKNGSERSLISYQDGPSAEWANGCYADEVPLWLLLGLFGRIKSRKPLGDQIADETIAAVNALEAAYVQAKHDEHPPKLNVIPSDGDEL